VAAFLLTAVGGTGWQTCVALSADHLVNVVLGGENLQGRLDNPATETEDEMKSGFLLDVVIRQCAAILKLLASEDQSLLVRRNAFLILDLGLDIVDGIGGLDLKSDGLASEGLYEDLHLVVVCM